MFFFYLMSEFHSIGTPIYTHKKGIKMKQIKYKKEGK